MLHHEPEHTLRSAVGIVMLTENFVVGTPSVACRSSCCGGVRRRGGRGGLKGSAHDAHGDECGEWEAGVWELRARVCGQGGDREFPAAEPYGLIMNHPNGMGEVVVCQRGGRDDIG